MGSGKRGHAVEGIATDSALTVANEAAVPLVILGGPEIKLTDAEVARLEAPYTPRYDFQGISDDAELARISARIGIKPAGA